MEYCNCEVGTCWGTNDKETCVFEFAIKFKYGNAKVKLLLPKRVNDLEFRYSAVNKAYELVKWTSNETSESCYVVVLWDKCSNGYNIKFIGDRPFNLKNKYELWNLMEEGQTYLNRVFDLENE